MPRHQRPVRGGATLVELLVVISLLGIVAAIATPPVAGWLAAIRVRAVTDRLTADIHLARMHAMRTGARTEIAFEWDRGRRCVLRYHVRSRVGDEPALSSVDVASTLVTGCLSMTNARQPLVFDSRGFPHGVMARTIVARAGTVSDTIVVSQLGRVLRVY